MEYIFAILIAILAVSAIVIDMARRLRHGT